MVLQGSKWVTIEDGKGDPSKDKLVEVLKNGILLVDHPFADIRARSNGEEEPVTLSSSIGACVAGPSRTSAC